MPFLKSHSGCVIFLLSICSMILIINFLEINSMNPCAQTFIRYRNILFSNSTQPPVLNSTVTTTTTTTTTSKMTSTQQITDIVTINYSKTPKVKFKSLIELLPHYRENGDYDPMIEITKQRNCTLVMGISTVKRDIIYLYDTLNSIFSALSYDKLYENDVLLIISIPE
ncbi:unnamed protein product, partial [Brachionus calyciflorus]